VPRKSVSRKSRDRFQLRRRNSIPHVRIQKIASRAHRAPISQSELSCNNGTICGGERIRDIDNNFVAMQIIYGLVQRAERRFYRASNSPVGRHHIAHEW
jgi:hypothetical protein